MAILNFNPMAYLKYYALNSPMIIGAFIILSSAFNQDIKGVLFMTGAAIMMFIGQFFSSSLGRKVPKNADLAACNMLTVRLSSAFNILTPFGLCRTLVCILFNTTPQM